MACLCAVLGACTGSIVPPLSVSPSPTSDATPTQVVAPTPTPLPTPVPTPAPVVYRVRAGDTLGRIAAKYKRTIGQLVTANPAITDPNHIEVGQLIIIPPFDAPDIPPSIAVVQDPESDLVDELQNDTSGPGYADLVGFAVRLNPADLSMEVQLVTSPPTVDPSVETVSYVINIDTSGDGEPDYTVSYANDLPGQIGYQAELHNRSTAEDLVGAAFPGTVEVTRTSVKISVALFALGSVDGTGEFAAAVAADRTFRADGPTDSTVEQSVDLAPDQQWPRQNARWLTVAR